MYSSFLEGHFNWLQIIFIVWFDVTLMVSYYFIIFWEEKNFPKLAAVWFLNYQVFGSLILIFCMYVMI